MWIEGALKTQINKLLVNRNGKKMLKKKKNLRSSCDALTNVRNDSLNANVIQVVCLSGVIIQDGERQQQGISG